MRHSLLLAASLIALTASHANAAATYQLDVTSAYQIVGGDLVPISPSIIQVVFDDPATIDSGWALTDASQISSFSLNDLLGAPLDHPFDYPHFTSDYLPRSATGATWEGEVAIGPYVGNLQGRFAGITIYVNSNRDRRRNRLPLGLYRWRYRLHGLRVLWHLGGRP